MKRVGNLINKIVEPENIRLAFWKSQQGKQDKPDVINFRSKLEKNILILRNELLSGELDIGHYSFFNIYDPKERMICAASFKERVLHHAIMNICEPIFEKLAIYNSYACMKGKGSHKAVEKAKLFSKRYSCFLKLDIRKYFLNIDHEILKNLLKRKFKDKQLLDIFYKIIDSYENKSGKGLPIGNLLSQHWANYYLGFLDRWIKETKQIKGYIRYMDDFILFVNDKEVLKNMLSEIKTFLNDYLKLELKDNAQLNYVYKGIPFLGYRVFPNKIRLSTNSKKRFVKKLRNYKWKYKNNSWDELTLQNHVTPLLEFVKFADSINFRKNLIFGDLS